LPALKRLIAGLPSRTLAGRALRAPHAILFMVWIVVFLSGSAQSQTMARATRTQVVLLGTGAPRPLPDRSGPSTAIVVDDTPYLVDFGPGVVRRAAAAFEKGVRGLSVERLETAFVTHLHSDHTVGYPDLIFTPWVVGRKRPLHVYGPRGIASMTDHVLRAWQEDIDIRTKGKEGKWPLAVRAHEVEPGVVYQDDRVTVTAIPVRHGDWRQAYGYAFKTPDRTVVISGDASPSPALIDACRSCDILIHEAYASNAVAPMPNWTEYRAVYHTSTRELAEIAKKTQPGLLIVYHLSQRGPNGLIPEAQYLQEIEETYKGKVVIGHDLEVY
jgi:ribonuclease BN (tRNA processing enzyme)